MSTRRRSLDTNVPHATLETQGYKPGEKKSVQEYAELDAGDESLNRWKASLGLAASQQGDTNKPKVCGV